MRIFLAVLALFSASAAHADTFLYTIPGNYNFQVPWNWNDADNEIDCTGGGSIGAYTFGGTQAGSGGGGGMWAQSVDVTLTPGLLLNVTVGNGGDAGLPCGDCGSFMCYTSDPCHYNTGNLIVYAVDGDGATVTGAGTMSTPGLGAGNFAPCPSSGVIYCGYGQTITNGNPGGLGPANASPPYDAPGAAGGAGVGPFAGAGGAGGAAYLSGPTYLCGAGAPGGNYGAAGGGSSNCNPGQGGIDSGGAGSGGICRISYTPSPPGPAYPGSQVIWLQ